MALIFRGTAADEEIDERGLGRVNPGDAVDGGAGNDLFILTSGSLWVLGGSGNDTIDGSRVSGQIGVNYGSAPKGITFDSESRRVEDGYGSVDTLIGDIWWVFGSQQDDFIRINAGQVYSLDGNDTIEAGLGVYVVPGPGADSISGTRLTISYLDDPALVVGSLTEGWVVDGWGFRDTVRGASTLLLGGGGSNLIGSPSTEIFEILQGGSHTIDGGGGGDRIKVNRSVNDFDISAAGKQTLFVHKVTGERLSLSNATVIFNDRTFDLSRPLPRFDDYAALPLKLDISAFVAKLPWVGNSISSSTQPVIVDINSDGRLDFVFHLFQDQSSSNWGAVTDAPTPNTLMAFLSQSDGSWRESTGSLFPNISDFSLTGASRKVSVGDLNGDGRPDWAYALNREDGRSGSPPVNSTSKAVVVLSAGPAVYTLKELGEPNWYHQVLIDSMLLGQPTVMFAGYYRSPGLSLTPEGLSMGGGYAFQWDAAGGDFGASLAIPGHPNTFATLRSPAGAPQVMTVFDLQTPSGPKQAVTLIDAGASGWTVKDIIQPYRSVITKFVSYSNDRGTAELFELAPGVFGIAAGYSESVRMALYPGDESTTVFKFSAAQITSPRADGYYYQNDGTPVQILDFFRSSGDSIQRLPIRIQDEDRLINANFLEVLDFNGDGLQDLVVYPYIEGGAPRVYLNTGGDLFVRVSESIFPSAPLGWGVSASSKFADINSDGVWDLLYFPSNGFSRTQDDNLQWPVFLGLRAFDSGSITSDLVITDRLGSNTIRLWAGNDVIHENGRRVLGVTSIDAGSGIDTAIYSGKASSYLLKFNLSTNTVSLTDKTAASDGIDTFASIERLQFADKTIRIDTKAHGSYADLPDTLYQFFVVGFGAAPGVTYMDQMAEAYRYWLPQYKDGTVKQIVEAFTTKSQFTSVYPQALYRTEGGKYYAYAHDASLAGNPLVRGAEVSKAVFDTQMASLAQGLVATIVKTSASEATKGAATADIQAALGLGGDWTIGKVIYTVFGNLASKPLSDPTWGGTAKQFANQVAVAKYYTDTLSQSTDDITTLRSVMAAVTNTTDVSSTDAIASLIGVALLNGPGG